MTVRIGPHTEIRINGGTHPEMATRQPGIESLRKGKFICTKSFRSSEVPGYEGELKEFKAGATCVSSDHAILRVHPENFAEHGTRAATSAIRSASKGGRRGAEPRRQTTPPSDGPAPAFEFRSKAPWNLPPEKIEAPQIRRARAVTGDEIYNLGTISFSIDNPEPALREMRDRSMRAIERARFPHGRANPDAIRGYLAELISDDESGTASKRVLVTGSPEFRKMFARAIRGMPLTRTEEAELRGIQLTEPTDGGFLVPYTLDPTMIQTSSGVINPLRSISRLGTCVTNEWWGVSTTGMSAGYGGEGSETEDDSPTFSQPKLPMHKADAWAPAAYEMDQDYAALEPAIAGLLQRSKDELEATEFLRGDGKDKPEGLLTGATEQIETATKGVFVAADLEGLEDALPEGFQHNGTWLGARKTFKRVRNFNREGGAQIWEKLPGSPPEINGLPARELSTLDSTISGGKQILILGDFQCFQIIDRIGMSLKLIQEVPGESHRPTGQMGVFAMWRNNSQVLAPKAFRILRVKS